MRGTHEPVDPGVAGEGRADDLRAERASRVHAAPGKVDPDKMADREGEADADGREGRDLGAFGGEEEAVGRRRRPVSRCATPSER